MKNFKLNPAVSKFNFSILCSFEQLEELGWDFYVDEKGDYDPVVVLGNESGELRAGYYLTNGKDNSDTENAGDIEDVVSDIITLLNNESLSIDNDIDYSEDINGNYVPTFIEE